MTADLEEEEKLEEEQSDADRVSVEESGPDFGDARRRLKQAAILVGVLVVGIALGALVFGGTGGDADEASAGSTNGHDHADGATTWTCSMHPQVQSDEPGQCPICGMDLIPVEKGDSPEPDEVRLTDRARQLAEIRTSPVVRAEDASVDLHLLGRLEYAESQQKTVTAWTGGRIDDLHVDTTGEKVRRGQVIATLYSPEVYAAHQDLIVSRRQVAKLEDGKSFAKDSAESTLRSARQKLRLLGVPDREIDRMEEADEPWQHVRIRSPFSGTVIERLVSEGNYVTAGTGLYKVADLGKLWVQLDAYEPDLARLEGGQKVELKVAAFPGERFEGEVSFIDPVVDPKTRTAQVRVEVENPDGRLRPGMFAEAMVSGGTDGDGDEQAPLVIPETAPLFSGRRSIAYVRIPSQDRPAYAARDVRLGPKMGDVYPVVAGLHEGEHVVTHGAFALDADLQIRGGKSLMMRGDDTSETPFDQIVEVPAAFLEKLEPIVSGYLAIQRALAEDDLPAAKAAADEVRREVGAFAPREPVQVADVWLPLRAGMLAALDVMAAADTLEAARAPFEHLTKNVTTVLHRLGNPLDSSLHLAFCPMAFDDEGAEWIQKGEAIDNAYFGRRMRSCGEIRAVIPGGGGHYVPRTPAEDPPASAPPKGHQH